MKNGRHVTVVGLHNKEEYFDHAGYGSHTLFE